MKYYANPTEALKAFQGTFNIKAAFVAKKYRA